MKARKEKRQHRKGKRRKCEGEREEGKEEKGMLVKRERKENGRKK